MRTTVRGQPFNYRSPVIRRSVRALSLCASLLCICCLSCESVAVEETVPPELLLPSVFALTQWDTGNDTFLVTVQTERIANDGNIPDRKLTAYKKEGDKYKAVFICAVGPDAFVGMLPFSDNSPNLMTLWTGGSAYHIRILTAKNHTVSLALDVGSSCFPEIVDTNNDGNLDVLISEEVFQTEQTTSKILCRPDKTKIYQQEQGTFKPTRTVLWKERLK